MRAWISLVILLFGCFDTRIKASALNCWKCIAHDCDSDPEDNYKASKIKCQEGQRCMKVRYRMFDNVTHYDSVIRTCTDNACETSSQDEFYSCVATPTKYLISGCKLRSCCDDRDLCNYSGSVHLLTYSLTYALLICSSLTDAVFLDVM